MFGGELAGALEEDLGEDAILFYGRGELVFAWPQVRSL